MLKKNKKEIIIFIVIFIISVIMCSGFIRMHYTTDTYKVADAGYTFYAKNWSLKDGRIIMWLLLNLAEILKIKINVVNYICTIVGLIISTISVMEIRKMIINIKKPDNKLKEASILLISYLVVFNLFYVETIYFLETIIISFSILCYILATKSILNKSKNYILKALILAIVGTISYQGTISFFIILACGLSIIKYNKINKQLIKDICIIGIITLVSVLLDILLVNTICNLLGLTQARFNILDAQRNIKIILSNIGDIIIYNCGLNYKLTFVMLIALIILMSLYANKNNTNKEYVISIINTLVIVIITIIASFVVFIPSLSSFSCGRMYIGLGALPMILFINLFVNSSAFDNKIFSKILITILIVTFIYNAVNYIRLINESRYKNYLEKEYCEKINNYIKENNIEIEAAMINPIFGYVNEIYFEEIDTKNKMTSNELLGYEAAISGFNIITNQKIPETKYNSDLAEKYAEKFQDKSNRIEGTYSLIIDNILIMPAFIW